MERLLARYQSAMLSQDYSPHTVRAKVGTIAALMRHAGVDELEDLTSDDVVAFVAGRQLSQWSRLKYLEHVKAFCQWAGVDDLTAGIRRPRTPTGIPRPVAEPRLELILAACQHGRDDRERAWVLLGAYCGLRAHESAKVAVEDLEQAPDGTHLLRVLGKGRQEALIPVPPVVMVVLEQRARQVGRGRLWPRATAASVQATMRRLSKRAGVRVVSHELRHRYGTVFYAESRDLLATQQAMRHASPTTTAGYALVVADRVSAIVQALPGAQGAPEAADGRHLRVVR